MLQGAVAQAAMPGLWHPRLIIGRGLAALWHADYGVTQSGGLVSAWRDMVGHHALAQATAASRPAFSGTGLNGRACLTLDGSDDYMELGAVPASFPTAGAAGRLLGLVSQDRAVATAGVNYAAAYGGTGANGVRAVARNIGAGANRLRVDHGGANLDDTAHDFSGVHLVGGGFAADGTVSGVVDGQPTSPASLASTINTGTTRVRLGASVSTTPGSFFLGKVRGLAITDARLEPADAHRLEAWMLWDAGRNDLIPEANPYRRRRP